mmetsp:Transcript_111529/g.175739  ORF Transcript_111529/g.175739 Transcript_111529/m.175739 type:complete len:263 (-) Transcript_111529:17-805(-)
MPSTLAGAVRGLASDVSIFFSTTPVSWGTKAATLGVSAFAVVGVPVTFPACGEEIFAFAFGCAGSALAPVPRDKADPVISMRSAVLIGVLPSTITAAADVGAALLVVGAGLLLVSAGPVVGTFSVPATLVVDVDCAEACFALVAGAGALAAFSGFAEVDSTEACFAVLARVLAATSGLSTTTDVFVVSSTSAAAFVGFVSSEAVFSCFTGFGTYKVEGAAFTSGAPGFPGAGAILEALWSEVAIADAAVLPIGGADMPETEI